MYELPDDTNDELPPHFCQHTLCTNEALACYVPRYYLAGEGPEFCEPDAWYCGEHASLYGFCNGCGELHGGEEGFETNERGLCDACQAQWDHENETEDDWDEDEREWDDYPHVWSNGTGEG